MLLERLSAFNALDLVVLILATYRLSTMLANDWETGPRGFLTNLRALAGMTYTQSGDPVAPEGSLADGLLCRYCNSVWIGTTFTILFAILLAIGLPAYLLFLPLALSGANIIIVELIEKLPKLS